MKWLQRPQLRDGLRAEGYPSPSRACDLSQPGPTPPELPPPDPPPASGATSSSAATGTAGFRRHFFGRDFFDRRFFFDYFGSGFDAAFFRFFAAARSRCRRPSERCGPSLQSSKP